MTASGGNFSDVTQSLMTQRTKYLLAPMKQHLLRGGRQPERGKRSAIALSEPYSAQKSFSA